MAEVPLYQEIPFSLSADAPPQASGSGGTASRAPTQHGSLGAAKSSVSPASDGPGTLGALSLLANHVSDSEPEADTTKVSDKRLPTPVERAKGEEKASSPPIASPAKPSLVKVKKEPTAAKSKPKLQVVADSPPPVAVTAPKAVKPEKPAKATPPRPAIHAPVDHPKDHLRSSPRRSDKQNVHLMELLDAGILKMGDALEYKEEEGLVLASGWIEWDGHTHPDLVVWAIEVAKALGEKEKKAMETDLWATVTFKGKPLSFYRKQLQESGLLEAKVKPKKLFLDDGLGSGSLGSFDDVAFQKAAQSPKKAVVEKKQVKAKPKLTVVGPEVVEKPPKASTKAKSKPKPNQLAKTPTEIEAEQIEEAINLSLQEKQNQDRLEAQTNAKPKSRVPAPIFKDKERGSDSVEEIGDSAPMDPVSEHDDHFLSADSNAPIEIKTASGGSKETKAPIEAEAIEGEEEWISTKKPKSRAQSDDEHSTDSTSKRSKSTAPKSKTTGQEKGQGTPKKSKVPPPEPMDEDEGADLMDVEADQPPKKQEKAASSNAKKRKRSDESSDEVEVLGESVLSEKKAPAAAEDLPQPKRIKKEPEASKSSSSSQTSQTKSDTASPNKLKRQSSLEEHFAVPEPKSPTKKPSAKEPATKVEKSERKKIVLASSGLKSKMLLQLRVLENKLSVAIESDMSKSVTHLVVSPTDDKLVPRTIKYLAALALRAYVLSVEWVVDCIAAGKIVDETPYVMAGDKTALGAPEAVIGDRGLPGIFNGYTFYFHGEFTSPSKAELEKLANYGGGIVRSKPPVLTSMDEVMDTKHLVVCNADCLAETVKKVCLESGVQPIGHAWLFDSLSFNSPLATAPFHLKMEDESGRLEFQTQMSLAMD